MHRIEMFHSMVLEIIHRAIELKRVSQQMEPAYKHSHHAVSRDPLGIFHDVTYSGVRTTGDNDQTLFSADDEG